MKILKNLGIAILGLILLVVIVSLFISSKVHVERSVVIKAPAPIVFEQVNTLKNWEKWSPWADYDTNMVMQYEGPASGEGASYSWKSDVEQVGSGKLTITKSIPFDTVYNEMDFMENGKGMAYFALSKSDTGTNLTWAMETDMGWNPIGKIVGLFMDKMVGPDFEKGLSRIKEVSEKAPLAPPLMARAQNVAGFEYLSVSGKCEMSQIGATLGSMYAEIGKVMAAQKLQQSGPPSCFYHHFEPTSVSLEAFIPVNGTPKSSGNVKAGKIASGEYAFALFTGPYENSEAGHKVIQEWAQSNNKVLGDSPWESYVNDPGTVKDPAKYQTAIYYPIKK
jgi:hypothetical protein